MKLENYVIAYGVLKGCVIATATLIVGTTFLQSVAIALISGSLGVIGMIGAAYIATRSNQRDREVLHDIRRKVTADKRQADKDDT